VLINIPVKFRRGIDVTDLSGASREQGQTERVVRAQRIK
jgi:hypothetical protein